MESATLLQDAQGRKLLCQTQLTSWGLWIRWFDSREAGETPIAEARARWATAPTLNGSNLRGLSCHLSTLPHRAACFHAVCVHSTSAEVWSWSLLPSDVARLFALVGEVVDGPPLDLTSSILHSTVDLRAPGSLDVPLLVRLPPGAHVSAAASVAFSSGSAGRDGVSVALGFSSGHIYSVMLRVSEEEGGSFELRPAPGSASLALLDGGLGAADDLAAEDGHADAEPGPSGQAHATARDVPYAGQRVGSASKRPRPASAGASGIGAEAATAAAGEGAYRPPAQRRRTLGPEEAAHAEAEGADDGGSGQVRTPGPRQRSRSHEEEGEEQGEEAGALAAPPSVFTRAAGTFWGLSSRLLQSAVKSIRGDAHASPGSYDSDLAASSRRSSGAASSVAGSPEADAAAAASPYAAGMLLSELGSEKGAEAGETGGAAPAARGGAGPAGAVPAFSRSGRAVISVAAVQVSGAGASGRPGAATAIVGLSARGTVALLLLPSREGEAETVWRSSVAELLGAEESAAAVLASGRVFALPASAGGGQASLPVLLSCRLLAGPPLHCLLAVPLAAPAAAGVAAAVQHSLLLPRDSGPGAPAFERASAALLAASPTQLLAVVPLQGAAAGSVAFAGLWAADRHTQPQPQPQDAGAASPRCLWAAEHCVGVHAAAAAAPAGAHTHVRLLLPAQGRRGGGAAGSALRALLGPGLGSLVGTASCAAAAEGVMASAELSVAALTPPALQHPSARPSLLRALAQLGASSDPSQGGGDASSPPPQHGSPAEMAGAGAGGSLHTRLGALALQAHGRSPRPTGRLLRFDGGAAALASSGGLPGPADAAAAARLPPPSSTAAGNSAAAAAAWLRATARVASLRQAVHAAFMLHHAPLALDSGAFSCGQLVDAAGAVSAAAEARRTARHPAAQARAPAAAADRFAAAAAVSAALCRYADVAMAQLTAQAADAARQGARGASQVPGAAEWGMLLRAHAEAWAALYTALAAAGAEAGPCSTSIGAASTPSLALVTEGAASEPVALVAAAGGHLLSWGLPADSAAAPAHSAAAGWGAALSPTAQALAAALQTSLPAPALVTAVPAIAPGAAEHRAAAATAAAGAGLQGRATPVPPELRSLLPSAARGLCFAFLWDAGVAAEEARALLAAGSPAAPAAAPPSIWVDARLIHALRRTLPARLAFSSPESAAAAAAWCAAVLLSLLPQSLQAALTACCRDPSTLLPTPAEGPATVRSALQLHMAAAAEAEEPPASIGTQLLQAPTTTDAAAEAADEAADAAPPTPLSAPHGFVRSRATALLRYVAAHLPALLAESVEAAAAAASAAGAATPSAPVSAAAAQASASAFLACLPLTLCLAEASASLQAAALPGHPTHAAAPGAAVHLGAGPSIAIASLAQHLPAAAPAPLAAPAPWCAAAAEDVSPLLRALGARAGPFTAAVLAVLGAVLSAASSHRAASAGEIAVAVASLQAAADGGAAAAVPAGAASTATSSSPVCAGLVELGQAACGVQRALQASLLEAVLSGPAAAWLDSLSRPSAHAARGHATAPAAAAPGLDQPLVSLPHLYSRAAAFAVVAAFQAHSASAGADAAVQAASPLQTGVIAAAFRLTAFAEHAGPRAGAGAGGRSQRLLARHLPLQELLAACSPAQEAEEVGEGGESAAAGDGVLPALVEAQAWAAVAAWCEWHIAAAQAVPQPSCAAPAPAAHAGSPPSLYAHWAWVAHLAMARQALQRPGSGGRAALAGRRAGSIRSLLRGGPGWHGAAAAGAADGGARASTARSSTAGAAVPVALALSRQLLLAAEEEEGAAADPAVLCVLTGCLPTAAAAAAGGGSAPARESQLLTFAGPADCHAGSQQLLAGLRRLAEQGGSAAHEGQQAEGGASGDGLTPLAADVAGLHLGCALAYARMAVAAHLAPASRAAAAAAGTGQRTPSPAAAAAALVEAAALVGALEGECPLPHAVADLVTLPWYAAAARLTRSLRSAAEGAGDTAQAGYLRRLEVAFWGSVFRVALSDSAAAEEGVPPLRGAEGRIGLLALARSMPPAAAAAAAYPAAAGSDVEGTETAALAGFARCARAAFAPIATPAFGVACEAASSLPDAAIARQCMEALARSLVEGSRFEHLLDLPLAASPQLLQAAEGALAAAVAAAPLRPLVPQVLRVLGLPAELAAAAAAVTSLHAPFQPSSSSSLTSYGPVSSSSAQAPSAVAHGVALYSLLRDAARNPAAAAAVLWSLCLRVHADTQALLGGAGAPPSGRHTAVGSGSGFSATALVPMHAGATAEYDDDDDDAAARRQEAAACALAQLRVLARLLVLVGAALEETPPQHALLFCGPAAAGTAGAPRASPPASDPQALAAALLEGGPPSAAASLAAPTAVLPAEIRCCQALLRAQVEVAASLAPARCFDFLQRCLGVAAPLDPAPTLAYGASPIARGPALADTLSMLCGSGRLVRAWVTASAAVRCAVEGAAGTRTTTLAALADAAAPLASVTCHLAASVAWVGGQLDGLADPLAASLLQAEGARRVGGSTFAGVLRAAFAAASRTLDSADGRQASGEWDGALALDDHLLPASPAERLHAPHTRAAQPADGARGAYESALLQVQARLRPLLQALHAQLARDTAAQRVPEAVALAVVSRTLDTVSGAAAAAAAAGCCGWCGSAKCLIECFSACTHSRIVAPGPFPECHGVLLTR